MTVQAQAMGLGCRQFRAFELAAVARTFDVADEWEVRTMTAVGIPATAPLATWSRAEPRRRRDGRDRGGRLTAFAGSGRSGQGPEGDDCVVPVGG